jgi:cephalosporin hydroxylase
MPKHSLATLARVAIDRATPRAPDPARKAIATQFHRLFYHVFQQRHEEVTWMGTPVNKCPTDLWMYQQLLHRIRPAVIVETGTAWGGSALYLAGLCDLLDHGRVVTVDVTVEPRRPAHDRITYLNGSSTAPEMVAEVGRLVDGASPVLVILDSDHRYSHVRDELAAYADLVTPDSYLIVEDTNLNGHPVVPEFGPGPMEAVREFLAGDRRFERDAECEQFLVTYNPHGYLRRAR